jgi:hypothetical protein
MISVRYAVCSEQEKKPVVRAVVETRQAADQLMAELRRQDMNDPTISYWLAELGPECDAWRFLGTQSGEAS